MAGRLPLPRGRTHKCCQFSLRRTRGIAGLQDGLQSALTLATLSCYSLIMLNRLNTSFFRIAATRPTMPTRLNLSVRLFSNLALRKPYPLLSETPCKLAYIKSCKCCQLRPYIHFHPQDPHGEKVKGSLDSIMPNGILLEDDSYDIGEVAISPDGLLRPETAC